VAVYRQDCIRKDRMIKDEVRLCNRNLSYCWIDYCKAFDSISHGYMLEVMPILQPFQLLLASLVQNWCTCLELGFGASQTSTVYRLRSEREFTRVIPLVQLCFACVYFLLVLH